LIDIAEAISLVRAVNFRLVAVLSHLDLVDLNKLLPVDHVGVFLEN
jgi:hypothetical protein